MDNLKQCEKYLGKCKNYFMTLLYYDNVQIREIHHSYVNEYRP